MAIVNVVGYCPMGCGQTLHLNPEAGMVYCIDHNCPRPGAVTEILRNPETEHVVLFSDEDFSVQHPLRERIEGSLFTCPLFEFIKERERPPKEELGWYRVVPNKWSGWTFDRIREL